MSPYTFPCAHRLPRTHTHRHKSGAALSCGLPFKGVLSTCYYAITLKGFSHFSSHSRLSLESSFSIATFAHDGTERRIVRPQDPVEQRESYSGKKKDNTVKNVLLVNALLTILFLSDTYGGPTHDKPIAAATPYPLPAGSRLLQDLGFLAFTLPEVTILMPTKKPRGQELSLEEQLTNQALLQRRLRIEHVNSSVKRCRIVKDRIRLWKEGVRDLVMELCCALHNFRVRLNPWLPMI